MNHGFVLNDGTSRIRSSYFPVSSVIVRDDPHYSREEVYTGTGARVGHDRLRWSSGGGAARGGRIRSTVNHTHRMHPAGQLGAASASPAEPALPATPAGRSSMPHEETPNESADAMLHHQQRRRRPARPTAGGLPSYMAPTTCSERKHRPEGGDKDDDITQENGVEHSDHQHHHDQHSTSHQRHVKEESHLIRSRPISSSGGEAPVQSTSSHKQKNPQANSRLDPAAVTPPPRNRKQSNGATGESSSVTSPPPPARFRAAPVYRHDSSASHHRPATAAVHHHHHHHQPIIISHVTALPLDEDDEENFALYDSDDLDDGFAAAAIGYQQQRGHQRSNDAHEEASLSSLVSAESSITQEDDVVTGRPIGGGGLLSSFERRRQILLSDEASWRDYLMDDECEFWIELMDIAMDEVAEIMLQKRLGPSLSAAVTPQSLSPMSNSAAPVVELATGVEPLELDDSTMRTTHDGNHATLHHQHIEGENISGSNHGLHLLSVPIAASSPSTSSSPLSSSQRESRPPQLEETRAIAVDDVVTASNNAEQQQPSHADLAGNSNELCESSPTSLLAAVVSPTTASVILPHFGGDVSALPPQLQQYLQALHFQTVMLTEEMRKVTESHSTLSLDLVHAQRQIEAMQRETDQRGNHQQQQVPSATKEGETVTGDDDQRAGAAASPGTPDVPVHPAFAASNDGPTTASPAQPPLVEVEGLEVEGAGNIARSVYHLLAYPLQCCMRRPT
ncbi:Hypothetical protein, putative [Bodo saltans]|uniref:Uncharacterized protein n=1 Tax=Bodo saltans TaxID=75058 RepID=A0A0S4KKL4_BODSA|nr:Hypothetical protein, putative [Bodo saltans]|eukprot:CUM57945.1 Hypothetical protein, putative [Bodo saltans]